MKRSIITTKDGSKTIRMEDWDEHYHSTHGALQEAMHVYIKAGLEYYKQQNNPKELRVLEAGFGTGLNALLTAKWAEENQIELKYTALEAYPLGFDEVEALDYQKLTGNPKAEEVFDRIHKAEWEQWSVISETFALCKKQLFFSEFNLENQADVIFYDAFGPRVQPELWETKSFEGFYKAMTPGGVFVTYCVKGTARRALQAIGLNMEIIEGPPGKRHMMRGIKST